MTIKSVAAGLCLGVTATLAVATSAQAGPAITTQWTDTTLTQAECLERAESATEKAGFGRLERTNQSRFGTRGDYTSSIRCISSKNLVFFVVSGPSRDESPRLMERLFSSF